ncbi:alanine-tRNA ligase [Allomyces macrogynus ATCC 38327]|uniref:Alanine--tRNA ligase n=1 Tax=Allomyces macrogynus (strain ATCC 38327) TaxID=578462 RepID=A0A0L0T3B6_ALLM3|nr:alanine-tRNA ligase [Allomyces macrogynus ATCC 38327]|eukprot:KNE69170.1 alanine-tRNA ligase [Allomyces macrogynus ATCC 38327]
MSAAARLRMLTAGQVRSKFVDYFATRGHRHVLSSSLIPSNDKSILFTNAGMVQFKQLFLNPTAAPYKAAVSVQKCVRAGGKHNDLDNVGYTPRHHTFFEMLGNFSFGSYDKTQAIRYAWEFLTEELQLPKGRLKATVLESDRQSLDTWSNVIGLPRSSIAQLTERDNWWSMGEFGPCGPCTEVFWDNHSMDPEQWLEIWNVVFMQHNKTLDGLSDLETLCIDTGMGLERVLSVLQGSLDNYQTDLFVPLLDKIRTAGTNHTVDPALHRIMADHVKSSVFLMSDGVIPGPVNRGYVLRKIIRRGARAAATVGGIQMTDLVPTVLDMYPPDLYPELHERRVQVTEILRSEEEFLHLILAGARHHVTAYLKNATSDTRVIPADRAFDMYASHGFPLDVVEMIAEEHGWTVDVDGAQILLEEHRHVSAGKLTAADEPTTKSVVVTNAANKFVGYDRLTVDTTVRAVDLADPPNAVVVLEDCPFYALGGGQAPDVGSLTITAPDGHQFTVPCRAVALNGDCTAVVLDASTLPPPALATGAQVHAAVDTAHRTRVAAHHSATHLVHYALRQVLGPHVTQAGSSVDATKLSFDFTHPKALTSDQLVQVQAVANGIATAAHAAEIATVPMTTAKTMGAAMHFADKYGDAVRVVSLGPAIEACCGTHVTSARETVPIVILSDRSVAAGTRRIEAVAGAAALPVVEAMQATLRAAAEMLPATGTSAEGVPLDLPDRIARVKAHTKTAQKAKDAMLAHLAKHHVGPAPREVAGVMVFHVDPSMEEAYVKRRIGALRAEGKDKPVVMTHGAQITALVPASADAKALVMTIVERFGGSGGGSKTMATGRVPKPLGDKAWDEAISAVLSK